jgi:hypothetical protein
MELKDVVLSTLAEMEDNESVKLDLQEAVTQDIEKNTKEIDNSEDLKEEYQESKDVENKEFSDDELNFLLSVRERLLVLFEGFQAPNNVQIESKIDMTLNFLEYTLATIDNRLEKLQKGNR